MPGDSRPKDGVASLAYGAGHPRLACRQDVDGRDKPGHDVVGLVQLEKALPSESTR